MNQRARLLKIAAWLDGRAQKFRALPSDPNFDITWDDTDPRTLADAADRDRLRAMADGNGDLAEHYAAQATHYAEMVSRGWREVGPIIPTLKTEKPLPDEWAQLAIAIARKLQWTDRTASNEQCIRAFCAELRQRKYFGPGVRLERPTEASARLCEQLATEFEDRSDMVTSTAHLDAPTQVETRTERSDRRRQKVKPELAVRGWSATQWALQTNGQVKPGVPTRYLSGITIKLQAGSARELEKALGKPAGWLPD